MLHLEELIAHYEKRVMESTGADDHNDLEILVSTLISLNALKQNNIILKKLAGALPARPGQGG